MQTLEFFESELLSSRKSMSSKFQHLLGCLDTKFCTKARKKCTAVDLAYSWCKYSSRHDETIDILAIAKFVVYQEKSKYHTQLAKLSFDQKSFLVDLTAQVYFSFF